jgi:hypothetical protein
MMRPSFFSRASTRAAWGHAVIGGTMAPAEALPFQAELREADYFELGVCWWRPA